MKKLFPLISAVLCAAMLLMPVSAAKTPDAATLYKRAMDKMSDATSYELVYTSKTVIEYDGKAPVELLETTNSRDVSPVDGTYQWETRTTSYRNSAVIAVEDSYRKDGNTYERTSEEGKGYSEEEEAIKVVLGDVIDLGFEVIDEAPKDATVETRPEGGYIVKFRVTGSELRDMSNNSSYSFLDNTGFDLRLNPINFIMVLNPDAQLESLAFAFVVSMSNDEISVKTKCYEAIRVLSVNQPMTIKLPGDLNTYTKY